MLGEEFGERGQGISSLRQPHAYDINIVLKLQFHQVAPSAGSESHRYHIPPPLASLALGW